MADPTPQLITKIIARTSIEGAHCWPDAPDGVAFLRHRHRHNFVILSEKRVQHADRQIEFISFAWEVQDFLRNSFPLLSQTLDVLDFGSLSCEAIAQLILQTFGLDAVEVYEDGENGARVETSQQAAAAASSGAA